MPRRTMATSNDVAALLEPVQAALVVLYHGVGASGAERRQAERQLLSLRRAPPPVAMAVCRHLVVSPDAATCLAMAQTITHLCRNAPEPEPSWAPALLGLLQAAADAGRPKPVRTALALGVCALIGRRRAWPAAEVVPTVCGLCAAGLGAAPTSAPRLGAALELLCELPVEISSDQLPLDEVSYL